MLPCTSVLWQHAGAQGPRLRSLVLPFVFNAAFVFTSRLDREAKGTGNLRGPRAYGELLLVPEKSRRSQMRNAPLAPLMSLVIQVLYR